MYRPGTGAAKCLAATCDTRAAKAAATARTKVHVSSKLAWAARSLMWQREANRLRGAP